MEISEIMVRYGELSTKGKNKKSFINRLAQNIRQALSNFENIKVIGHFDRTHVLLNGHDADLVIEQMSEVFGIQTLSPVMRVEKDTETIKQAVGQIIQERYFEGASFKITTKRADHTFEYDTMELNRILGSAVVEANPGIEVKMNEPDFNVRVEIRENGAFISIDTIPGATGMPVGTSGKGMLMLSGGIDSPVAGYLAMKRGVEIEAVHFHSPPYTSPQALQKAKDLTAKISKYSGSINFIEVPFTEIQEEIKRSIPEEYIMTVTRRFMMKITDIIREQRGGLAIFNGESLAQVASQTLESMLAINEVTNTPVLRPLVSMDKNEIVKIAETIDTFDLSILPYEDCCTIFTPPKPKTKPKVDKVKQFEENLDVEGLIERAVEGIKMEKITIQDEKGIKEEEEFADFL